MDDRRQPFPANAPCVSVSVTTSASTSANLPSIANDVRIVNEGPNHAYVSIGTGSQTATVPGASAANTCTPVLAGTDVTLSLPSSLALCQISAITATGTATLRVASGEGL